MFEIIVVMLSLAAAGFAVGFIAGARWEGEWKQGAQNALDENETFVDMKYMTVGEVAQLLNMTRSHANRALLDEGRLPYTVGSAGQRLIKTVDAKEYVQRRDTEKARVLSMPKRTFKQRVVEGAGIMDVKEGE